jgi:hypothetical protein
MNYLITDSSAVSLPNGSSANSSKSDLIDVDGMYKSSIVSSDGEDRFEGYVPEDFSFDLANNWDPIGGLGDAIPGLSAITGSLDQVSKRTLGGVQPFKYFSPQTWNGPSYLSLTLPFELNNWESSASDVLDPMVSMMRLVTPSTDRLGRLQVPGPNPIKSGLEQYADQAKSSSESGGTVSGDYTDFLEGKIFKCTVGNFFFMEPCVITNVSAAVDGQFEHGSGLPMSVVMNVQLQSYYPVSREDIEAWFYASRNGIATSSDQSGT